MRELSRRSWLLMSFGLACLASGLTSSTLAAEPVVKPGDSIIFLGDSITQAGVGPRGYVTLVKHGLAVRAKDQQLKVLGAGISGNKVPDLEKRLNSDVLFHKPNVVVIYIGINDVWHSKSGMGTAKDVYEAGLRRIIKNIQDVGGKVILCTPSVIGEKVDGHNPLDEMLDRYADISRTVAKDTNSQLLDLRKKFLVYEKDHNKDNLEKGTLTTDGVHLNDDGNRFVAECMLEALGFPEPTPTPAATADARKLRHFVLFKFKDDAKPEQVQAVVDAFGALPSKISTIIEFEKGTDVSVEMKAQGFTHGFMVTFANEKGREIYLPHPAHQEFVKLVGPVIDKVLVFDYWTK